MTEATSFEENVADAGSMKRSNSETVRLMNNESPEYVLEHTLDELYKVKDQIKANAQKPKSKAHKKTSFLLNGTAVGSESDDDEGPLSTNADLEDDFEDNVSDVWYQQTMDKFKDKPWYLRPTVFTLLTVLVLRVMCISLLMTPTVGILSVKLCNEFPLTANQTCDMKKVQIEQSNITSVVSLLVSIIGLSLSGKYGELSDRMGRVFVLRLMGFICVFHTVLMLVAFHPSVPFNKYFVIFALSSDITGGILSLISLGNAYISDIIPSNEGTLAGYISLLMSMVYGSIGFGPLTSSYIIKLFNNSLIAPFYFTTGISLVYLITVSFFVQESRHKDAQRYSAKVLLNNRMRRRSSMTILDLPKEEHMTIKQRMYVWFHMTVIEAVEPIGKLWIKKTATGSLVPRINTVLLIVIDMFFCSATTGFISVIMLYAIKQFKWTSVELGYYVSIIGLGKSALLITMPVILNFLKRALKFEIITNGVDNMDRFLLNISIMFLVVSTGLLLCKDYTWSLYLSGVFQALSAMISPTIQNCILKYSSKKITGQIFAAHTQLRFLIMLFLPIIFLQIYSRTFDSHPNLILGIPFVLSIISMVLFQFVKIIHDPLVLRRESEVDVPKFFSKNYGSIREQRPSSQRKLSILNK